MANDIIPYTGAATYEEALHRKDRLDRASDIFNRRFWGLAKELYEFAATQSFRYFNAESMSEWLQEGNGPVARSWGMFLIKAHYTYRVRLPEVLPEPERADFEYMLQNTKSENLQAIEPTVNRLLRRADGDPLPSDPAKDKPLAIAAAAEQIVALVSIAHTSPTPAATRTGVRTAERFTYKFTIADMPKEVYDWWLRHGMPPGLPRDREFYGFAQEIED